MHKSRVTIAESEQKANIEGIMAEEEEEFDVEKPLQKFGANDPIPDISRASYIDSRQAALSAQAQVKEFEEARKAEQNRAFLGR